MKKFKTLHYYVYFVLIFLLLTLFFMAHAKNEDSKNMDKFLLEESQEEFLISASSSRSRYTEMYLEEFKIELDFWLSIIPNKELVYRVMDSNLGIYKSLIFSLVKNESQFNPNAIGINSTSSDYGLFQLNSITYPNLTTEELLDIDNNITLGIFHLFTELRRFNWDIELSVKSYNAGPSRVISGNVPESTKRYWNKIQNDMIEYQTLFFEYFRENSRRLK